MCVSRCAGVCMCVPAVSASPRTVLAMGVPSISSQGQACSYVPKAGVPGAGTSPSTWGGGPVHGECWLPWSSCWTSARSLSPFGTVFSQLKGKQVALSSQVAGAPWPGPQSCRSPATRVRLASQAGPGTPQGPQSCVSFWGRPNHSRGWQPGAWAWLSCFNFFLSV